MDLAGESPARQRLATSRNRVLRGVGRPILRSVHRARVSLRDRASIVLESGADVFNVAEGSIGVAQLACGNRSGGVEERGRARIGVHRGTWEILQSPSSIRGKRSSRASRYKRPGPGARCRRVTGANRLAQRR